MALETQIYTAADLLRMPDDGSRSELVKGELRRMAPAGHQHGEIAVEITWRLAQYVKAHNLGKVFAAETGFLIATAPDTVRALDVAFVSRERVPARLAGEGYWPGAPDLAVEVISPGDTYTEVEEKVSGWLEAGTRLVWVINPRKRTVAIHRSLREVLVLGESETLDGGDVVPGWAMAVRDLFT